MKTQMLIFLVVLIISQAYTWGQVKVVDYTERCKEYESKPEKEKKEYKIKKKKPIICKKGKPSLKMINKYQFRSHFRRDKEEGIPVAKIKEKRGKFVNGKRK